MKRRSIVATLIMAIAVFVSAQNKTVKPAASRNADDEAVIEAMLEISGRLSKDRVEGQCRAFRRLS